VGTIVSISDAGVEILRRVDIEEVKEIIGQGEKLHVALTEPLKVLRGHLRAARAWAARVVKSGLETGTCPQATLSELEAESENFCVEMPEEMEMLHTATCGYCICRQPYGGFMVGCDGCEEWYHGACLGMTEAQAEKLDK
jgi:hypothetical protein